MPNLTGASVTPQPYRTPDSTDKIARNSNESEKWDDLLAIIYKDAGSSSTVMGANASTTLTSLEIPCPVPLTLELHGTWNPVINNTAGGETVTLFFNIAALKGGQANTGFAKGFGSGYGPGGATTQPQLVALSGFDIYTPGIYQVQLVGSTGTIVGGSVAIENYSLLVRRGLRPPS